MMDLEDLISRLEVAPGADRDLDWEIAVAKGEDVIMSKKHPGKMSDQFPYCLHVPGKGTAPIPRYTESMDAVVAWVVPEGHQWRVQHNGLAAVCVPGTNLVDYCKGANPAIALCIASFKAELQERGNGESQGD